MPPQILTDSESDGDVIPAKPFKQAQDASDVEDEVEDIPDEDGEEYIVEAIKDHKYEGKVSRMIPFPSRPSFHPQAGRKV